MTSPTISDFDNEAMDRIEKDLGQLLQTTPYLLEGEQEFEWNTRSGGRCGLSMDRTLSEFFLLYPGGESTVLPFTFEGYKRLLEDLSPLI